MGTLFGPKPDSSLAAIAYICVTSVLFRLADAAYDVSQNALISLRATDGRAVSRYATNKTVMASVDRLIASFLVFAALLSPSESLADMKLVAITVLPIVASGFGLAPLARRLLVTSMVTSTIIGPLLEHRLAGSVSKGTNVGALGTIAAVSGIALALPLGGAALLVLALAYGSATSGLANLIWERVGAIAHDHRINTGGQIDAPAFALLTTGLKLAIALSTLIFGVLIEPYRQGLPVAIWGMGGILALGAVGTWAGLRHPHSSQACALT